MSLSNPKRISTEPLRILVASAHAADFCSRAGGTIAKHVRKNDSVWVLDLSFGERGESMPFWNKKKEVSVDSVKAIRRKEAEEAAAILGAEIKFMDFDDNPLVIDRDRMLVLVREIRKIRPDIVITHYSQGIYIREPMNPDHQITGSSIVRACYYATCVGVLPEEKPHFFPPVFMYEPTVPLTEFTGFIPNVYIDITEVFQQKMDALSKFKRGQPNLPKYYTHYATHRGWQAKEFVHDEGCFQYAEAFYRYTPWLGENLPV